MINKLQCMAFSGLVLAIATVSNVAAQDSNPPILHVLPGNGIADSVEKTGFFPSTTGGIDALNLVTGKVLWSSKEANLPLITIQNSLFALKGNGNQLRVIKMDAGKQGQRLFESPPIPLPKWASATVAYGTSFRSSVRSNSSGLFLVWEASAFYSGGVQPTPEMVARARKNQDGVEKINKNTGKIESLDVKKIAAGKFFPMSQVAVNPKVGSLTLLLKDSSSNNPGNSFERRRTLQAVNGAKQIIWQRDIASPIQLPLRP
jgi:hypothetical protein